MKLKISLIIGFILLALGIGTVVFAITRDDFDLDGIVDSNIEYLDLEFSADNIDTIVIDVKSDNFSIKRSEDEMINIKSKKSENMYYEEIIEDNKLIIKQHFKHKVFNFTLGFIKPYELELPFEMLNEASIILNAGNLNIKNSSINNSKITNNAGNVKIVTNDMESITGNVDAGYLKIEASKIGNANLDVSAGNLNIKANEITSVVADVDAGNLKIESKITYLADLDVNAGNMTLNLIGNKDDYSINSKEVNKVYIKIDVDAGNKNIDYIN